MPSLPMKAQPLPPPGSPLELVSQRAFEILPNTAPFDTTGHPAMTVPCGLSEGFPIGLMLIGKHWGEATIYQAAHAFEQMADSQEERRVGKECVSTLWSRRWRNN